VFLCPAGCGDVCRITQYTDIRLRVIAVGLEIGCFPWLIEERSGSKDVYVRVEGGLGSNNQHACLRERMGGTLRWGYMAFQYLILQMPRLHYASCSVYTSHIAPIDRITAKQTTIVATLLMLIHVHLHQPKHMVPTAILM
jgi:hypothetical protein